MRNRTHSGHCTQLREQQSTKYNQLQLSTLSVFITWSVVHWKPKVKINLALVSTEQKNCWACCCWQAHTDSGEIAPSERVIKNCSCLRVQKGFGPYNTHPKSICYHFIAKNSFSCYGSCKFAGTYFSLLPRKPRKWRDYFILLPGKVTLAC